MSRGKRDDMEGYPEDIRELASFCRGRIRLVDFGVDNQILRRLKHLAYRNHFDQGSGAL